MVSGSGSWGEASLDQTRLVGASHGCSIRLGCGECEGTSVAMSSLPTGCCVRKMWCTGCSGASNYFFQQDVLHWLLCGIRPDGIAPGPHRHE